MTLHSPSGAIVTKFGETRALIIAKSGSGDASFTFTVTAKEGWEVIMDPSTTYSPTVNEGETAPELRPKQFTFKKMPASSVTPEGEPEPEPEPVTHSFHAGYATADICVMETEGEGDDVFPLQSENGTEAPEGSFTLKVKLPERDEFLNDSYGFHITQKEPFDGGFTLINSESALTLTPENQSSSTVMAKGVAASSAPDKTKAQLTLDISNLMGHVISGEELTVVGSEGLLGFKPLGEAPWPDDVFEIVSTHLEGGKHRLEATVKATGPAGTDLGTLQSVGREADELTPASLTIGESLSAESTLKTDTAHLEPDVNVKAELPAADPPETGETPTLPAVFEQRFQCTVYFTVTEQGCIDVDSDPEDTERDVEEPNGTLHKIIINDLFLAILPVQGMGRLRAPVAGYDYVDYNGGGVLLLRGGPVGSTENLLVA